MARWRRALGESGKGGGDGKGRFEGGGGEMAGEGIGGIKQKSVARQSTLNFDQPAYDAVDSLVAVGWQTSPSIVSLFLTSCSGRPPARGWELSALEKSRSHEAFGGCASAFCQLGTSQPGVTDLNYAFLTRSSSPRISSRSADVTPACGLSVLARELLSI